MLRLVQGLETGQFCLGFELDQTREEDCVSPSCWRAVDRVAGSCCWSLCARETSSQLDFGARDPYTSFTLSHAGLDRGRLALPTAALHPCGRNAGILMGVTRPAG